MGIVIAAYGVSSTLMTQIQLAVANPNNVKPESVDGSDDKYFTDSDVLDRVPNLLYLQSILYASVFIIGMTNSLQVCTPEWS